MNKSREYQKARKDFIECVLRYSKCIQDGGSFQECVKPNAEFPPECYEYRRQLGFLKFKQADRRLMSFSHIEDHPPDEDKVD